MLPGYEQHPLHDLPKSAMLYTPAALELALRCPFTGALSSGGDDDKPEMAESTLVRSEGAASTDMLVGWDGAREQRSNVCLMNENEIGLQPWGLWS